MKKVFILAILSGAIAGGIVSLIISKEEIKTNEDLIKEFYEVENAVHISPHHIRKHMGKEDEDFVLVDLRSQEEYETSHIAGALNVPAYLSPDKSAYGDVERIVGEFKKIQEEYINKDIIVYCYSAPCMTGRKIGKMLVEYDIYVKHLGIGWQKWRYYWNIWNHDGATPVNPANYISSGVEPGEVTNSDFNGCSIEGEFGC